MRKYAEHEIVVGKTKGRVVKMISEMNSDEAKILKAMALLYEINDARRFPVIKLQPYLRGKPNDIFQNEFVEVHNLEVNLNHPEFLSNYIDNLFRLGLAGRIVPPDDMNKSLDALKKSKAVIEAITEIRKRPFPDCKIMKGCWTTTGLGIQFFKA